MTVDSLLQNFEIKCHVLWLEVLNFSWLDQQLQRASC